MWLKIGLVNIPSSCVHFSDWLIWLKHVQQPPKKIELESPTNIILTPMVFRGCYRHIYIYTQYVYITYDLYLILKDLNLLQWMSSGTVANINNHFKYVAFHPIHVHFSNEQSDHWDPPNFTTWRLRWSRMLYCSFPGGLLMRVPLYAQKSHLFDCNI